MSKPFNYEDELKESVNSNSISYVDNWSPSLTLMNPMTRYGHPFFFGPCGWMPIPNTAYHPFMPQLALPMYGAFNVGQLKTPTPCGCDPCLCMPDSHCGCVGSRSMGMPAPIGYCNVCSQSIQPIPHEIPPIPN